MLNYFLSALFPGRCRGSELEAVRSLAELGQQAVDRHPESELSKKTLPLFLAIQRLSPGRVEAELAELGISLLREMTGFGMARSIFQVFEAIQQLQPDIDVTRAFAQLGLRLKPCAARILLGHLARTARNRETRAIALLGATQSHADILQRFALYEINEGHCPSLSLEGRSASLQSAVECWLIERQRVLQPSAWTRIWDSLRQFVSRLRIAKLKPAYPLGR